MGQKFKNATPYLIVGLVGFIAGLLASPHFWRDQPSGDAGAVGALLGPLMGQDFGNAIGDAMQQSYDLATTGGGCISEEGREKLVMLPRPARDNEIEVRQFLNDINAVTEEQQCQFGNDPQVDALVGLGSQNAAIMLEYSDRKIGFYVEIALKRFNDNATKGVVLSKLAAQPDLIDIVVDNGWEKDAVDVIIKELPYYVRDPLRGKWWDAAVSAARPQHFPVLIEAFLNKDPMFFGEFDKAYASLSNLPLFPVDELNLRWWESRATPKITTRLDATVAKYGAHSGQCNPWSISAGGNYFRHNHPLAHGCTYRQPCVLWGCSR